MKSLPKTSSGSLIKQEAAHPVRLIKAAQANKILNGGANVTHANHPPGETLKKPEIRMIHAGPDYCDLEVICGCGETTQVRCWNTPAAA